jgi:hypothetical protein
MDKNTHDAIMQSIEQIVRASRTWPDAKKRVAASYGEAFANPAEEIALDVHGKSWVFPPEQHSGRPTEAQPQKPAESPREPSVQIIQPPSPVTKPVPLGAMSVRVLWCTCIALIAALVFPPHYVVLTEGITTSLGFRFILSPPPQGMLAGLVYVPLLIVEIVVVLAVGFLAWIWARNKDLAC